MTTAFTLFALLEAVVLFQQGTEGTGVRFEIVEPSLLHESAPAEDEDLVGVEDGIEVMCDDEHASCT